MTTEADILGRPPVMRPLPAPDVDTSDDWKGESLIRNGKTAQFHRRGNAIAQRVAAARRAKVGELLDQGLSFKEIMLRLDLRRDTLAQDIAKVRQK
ncbi:hypothetical protein P7F88_25330 [Vibrio hannami]|uniref:hypothetical protein n=1 Tax=Vibrio hannami TaxID=2717094 RepID=UPI00240F7264|nr:hypothetical protein [Vibrio hannami]MDG3089188.1 hypothetical protein [Vibrio hannami]